MDACRESEHGKQENEPHENTKYRANMNETFMSLKATDLARLESL